MHCALSGRGCPRCTAWRPPFFARAAAVPRGEELVARSVASVNATSFEETLAPLDLAAAEMVIGYGRSAFLAHVHTDSAVRDAAQVAEERISKWNVGLPFRPEVYRAVRAFAA